MKLDNVDLSIIKEPQLGQPPVHAGAWQKNQIVSPVRHRACQTA